MSRSIQVSISEIGGVKFHTASYENQWGALFVCTALNQTQAKFAVLVDAGLTLEDLGDESIDLEPIYENCEVANV